MKQFVVDGTARVKWSIVIKAESEEQAKRLVSEQFDDASAADYIDDVVDYIDDVFDVNIDYVQEYKYKNGV